MSVLPNATQNITTQAFLTSLVTNAGLLALQVGAFLYLKQRLERIYSPRTFLPPQPRRAVELPKGLWGWLPAIITSPSEDIIYKNGLDAYVFLRFIKILVWIFLAFTILTMPILLPLDSVHVSSSQTGLNRFTWGNLDAPGDQSRYGIHLTLVYLSTTFVIVLIHREMRNFVRLRQQFLLSKSHSRLTQARTVLITSVPDELANEQAMLRFASFVPGGVDRVWFFRDTKVLNKLFAQRQTACENLESAISHILHRAMKAWRKSSQGRTEKKREDEERQQSAENFEYPSQPSRELLDQLVPRSRRPSHRTGFLGVFGPKVDTIEYYKLEISSLNLLITEARQNAMDGPFLGSAFVQCNLQMGAHALAQCVSYHEPSTMTNKWLEAHPKDVVWENLDDGAAADRRQFVISWTVTVGLIVAWAFPVAFIGTLSNITALCGKVTWLHFVCKAPIVARGIIQGVLPPLLLAILFSLVPYIFRALAWYECIPRYSLISLSVYRRFFLFLVIHGFLIVTLTAGITTAIVDILRSPASTIQALASRLPAASTFFLTYMVSQGLAGAGGAIVQIANLVLYFVRKWLLGRTPRQAFNVTFVMPWVDFGFVMPLLSLLATIGFTYSIISPLINVLALTSYGCLYVAWKFLFLQVFDQPREFETGGLYYPLALSYLFVGLYVEQICIACLFFLKISITRVSSIVEAVLMLVLLAITAFCHIVIYNSFHPITKFLAMSLATEKLSENLGRQRKRRPGFVDELKDELGVNAVEQELSTLSSEIRKGVAGVVDRLESVGDKNQNRGQHQTGISPQQEIPDLFSHVSDPDNGKSRQRYTPPVFSSSAPHSQQHHAKKSHSHSRKADHRRPEHDNDSSGDEEDFHDHAFDHPSNYQKQTWIWIPKDKLGLSTILVEELNEAGVAASDMGATMDGQGIVEVIRGPPDEPWKGGVEE